MRYLEGEEAEAAELYCGMAAELASYSKCQKAKHGSVLVNGIEMIGEGWNTPVPDEVCNPCRREDIHDHSLVERCNSTHAEHNTVDDAHERGNSSLIPGSTLYHARKKNGEVVKKNTPSCTTCSRYILKKGIAEVVLIDEQGFACYTAEEFNRLSYEYHEKK